MVVTALLQSSAAFLAILISLSTHGLLSVESVIPLVMGAHIGGTLTTLFSSLSAERADAVRVAAANTLYRLAAAVILLPFFSYFTRFIEWSAADLPRQVANAHLFSAVLMVILFLPLNKILSKWLIKLIPQRGDEGKKPRLIYITKAAPELPAVALAQARQEIRWLANKILENMVQILPRIIFYGDTKILQELERTEREVDWHYQELSKFFTELFRRNMTREQIVESHSYQLIIKELEYIADSLIVMARLGARIHAAQIMIEETDQEKAGELYIAVSSNFLTLLRYLERGDQALALLIIEAHQDIIEIYNQVQNSLTCRVAKDDQGMQELNSWLYKIGEHIVRIAKILQD
ncbi:Na/Pi cotransporter family protein [Dehalobacter restrictus]|uniref:Na/Pi cotransporter family protein n=1 Tax=Dehalobacter restrictus TaxID=55583 RepID=UPI001FAA2073|nr:Na/Pi symporter [Dehalobacter restrictus]